MRLFSLLAISSVLSAAPAFAADLGTYRPGAPYHSVVAPGADVCESHCAGDAQCKGWNYVKVNPRAPGVCEFNSKAVSPIESAISISGLGSAPLAANLSQGSTNTIRVGTSVSQPQGTIRVGQTGPVQSSPNRRIVRNAVPQQVQPRTAAYRAPSFAPAGGPVYAPAPAQVPSLTEQQNRYRQASGHIGAAQPSYQQQAARSQTAPQQRLLRDPRITAPHAAPNAAPGAFQGNPGFQYNLDGSYPVLARQVPQQRAPQQFQQPQQAPRAQGRPPIGVPIGGAELQKSTALQPNAIPRGSVNNPVTHQNGQARLQAAQARAQAEAQAQAAAALRTSQSQSFAQAKQSLFGSLNDDVQVPAPLAQLPLDPNAPIPTSQSRPVNPVLAEPLDELAGPPLR